jgi:hypothetical protein
MNSPLERRYRRVLRILPREYRRDREEEMVATLLDERGERLDRGPGLAESLAVLGLAVRTRLSRTASGQVVVIGDAARGIALLALALATVTAMNRMVEFVYRSFGHQPGASVPSVRHLVTLVVACLAIPAAFGAVMLGRTVLARVLGVIALEPGVADLVGLARGGFWAHLGATAAGYGTLWFGLLGLFLTATVGLARRPSRLWWLVGIAAVGAGLGSGSLVAGGYGGDSYVWYTWLGFLDNTGPSWAVALVCTGYLLVLRPRFDPRGTGAFALAAAALVTAAVQSGELLLSVFMFNRLIWGPFVVFAGLMVALAAFVVVLGAIGINRRTSAPGRTELHVDQAPLP